VILQFIISHRERRTNGSGGRHGGTPIHGESTFPPALRFPSVSEHEFFPFLWKTFKAPFRPASLEAARTHAVQMLYPASLLVSAERRPGHQNTFQLLMALGRYGIWRKQGNFLAGDLSAADPELESRPARRRVARVPSKSSLDGAGKKIRASTKQTKRSVFFITTEGSRYLASASTFPSCAGIHRNQPEP